MACLIFSRRFWGMKTKYAKKEKKHNRIWKCSKCSSKLKVQRWNNSTILSTRVMMKLLFDALRNKRLHACTRQAYDSSIWKVTTRFCNLAAGETCSFLLSCAEGSIFPQYPMECFVGGFYEKIKLPWIILRAQCLCTPYSQTDGNICQRAEFR